jgi:hypothetical protein
VLTFLLKNGLRRRDSLDYARRIIDECRNEQNFELVLMNESLGCGPDFPELTREDIRWWLGLGLVDQKVLLRLKLIERQIAFLAELENHEGDGVIAADTIRRCFPIYGDPVQMHHFRLDRPLPPPLINRIDNYLVVGSLIDPAARELVSAGFPTFNSWIREQIRSGII